MALRRMGPEEERDERVGGKRVIVTLVQRGLGRQHLEGRKRYSQANCLRVGRYTVGRSQHLIDRTSLLTLSL